MFLASTRREPGADTADCPGRGHAAVLTLHGPLDAALARVGRAASLRVRAQPVILVLLASAASGSAEIITSAALVILFVLITSPLSTHSIAQAARRRQSRGQERPAQTTTAPGPAPRTGHT